MDVESRRRPNVRMLSTLFLKNDVKSSAERQPVSTHTGWLAKCTVTRSPQRYRVALVQHSRVVALQTAGLFTRSHFIYDLASSRNCVAVYPASNLSPPTFLTWQRIFSSNVFIVSRCRNDAHRFILSFENVGDTKVDEYAEHHNTC